MAFTKNEIRVGLFIVVPLLILLLTVLLKLGYSIAGSTMDVYLKTDSITSIKKGTPIRIKGYQIGRVVEIKPVYKPALHFLATMRISRDIELFDDCTAVIQNQNIIGDPTIEFRNPERRGSPLLAGDVVEGIEVVNLEILLGNVNTLVSNLSSTVGVIKQITVDSRQNLKSLVSNLAGSVSNLNAILANSQKDLGSILGSFRETAKTMNEISVELKRHPMKFLFSGKKEAKE
jgi:ABC-type transporter Mla subunit MlaD